jgi:hypothetical protein
MIADAAGGTCGLFGGKRTLLGGQAYVARLEKACSRLLMSWRLRRGESIECLYERFVGSTSNAEKVCGVELNEEDE